MTFNDLLLPFLIPEIKIAILNFTIDKCIIFKTETIISSSNKY